MLMLLVATSLAADAAIMPADELSAAGKSLFSQRRYAEAIAKFRESNEARANTANIYNIGKCYERLGEAGLALRHYREYLRIEPEADKDVAVHTDVTNSEAQLSAEGKQQLVVFTEQPTAQVSVDGQPVNGAPTYVELEAGEHQLTVSADGYVTANLAVKTSTDRIAETTVVLRPGTGDGATVPISASEAGRAVTLRPAPEVAVAEAPNGGRLTVALVLGGAGVALVGTGVVFGVLALNHHRLAGDLQHGSSQADFNAAKEAAIREMVLANVAYGVGAAALGVGLSLAVSGGLFRGTTGPRVGLAPVAGGGLLVLGGDL